MRDVFDSTAMGSPKYPRQQQLSVLSISESHQEPEVRDLRTEERCRGSGKITTSPVEKRCSNSPVGCINPHTANPAGFDIAAMGMQQPLCPISKGKCGHENTAGYHSEQATSIFTLRASASNAKHMCNPKPAEIQKCTYITGNSWGLSACLLVFTSTSASRALPPSVSHCMNLH